LIKHKSIQIYSLLTIIAYSSGAFNIAIVISIIIINVDIFFQK